MNLIYQYWNGGELPPGAQAGNDNMRAYAERVGAQYRMDRDGNFMGAHSRYFDLLRPVYDDWFDQFDRVLFVDLDVFAVDGLTESIFGEPCADIGMCEEPGMPEYRDGRKKHINGASDRVWATLVRGAWDSDIPRDSKGRVRVFNSGVVMFTREGIRAARESFVPVTDYVDSINTVRLSGFYGIDQNYMDAMVHRSPIDFTELSPEWNRQVHGKDDGTTYDERTPDTKFVHIQLSGADHNDAAWHDAIVNP